MSYAYILLLKGVPRSYCKKLGSMDKHTTFDEEINEYFVFYTI